jgi:gliding motility-associated-like protein
MLTHLLRRLRGLPLLLLVLVIFSARPALASHFLGGEMNYRYLGANGPASAPFSYEITAVIYFNAYAPDNPAAPNGSLDISLYNKSLANQRISAGQIPRISLSGLISPPTPGNCMLPSPPRPFRLGVFRQTVNLPVSFDGYYAVLTANARNVVIDNINTSGNNTPMTLYLDMAAPLLPNSSPVFSDTAVAVICQGDTTIMLNSAVDTDGDRLVYAFGAPAQGFPGITFLPPPPPVPYYANHSVAQPFGPGGFASLNATTGLAKYKAANQGEYVIAIDVSEYRNINGQEVLIGVTRRDLQLVARVCPANPAPQLPPTSGGMSLPRNYTIEEGQSVTIPFSATDPNNDALVLQLNSVLLDGTVANGFDAALSGNQGTVQPGNVTGTAQLTGTGSVAGSFVFNSRCGNGRSNPYNISVTVQDRGCGGQTIADVFSIQVNRAAGPNAITGPTVVCDPATIRTYTAAGPVPASYSWRITGGTITSGQGTGSVQVQWNSTPTTGTLVLKGISNFGCPTDSVTTNVDIRPLPALSVTPTAPALCRGASTTLTVTGAAGLTYTWTAGTQTFTGNSITVTPTVTTTYTVTGTDGTCTTSSQVTVTVTPPPTADAGPNRSFCSGGSAQLGTPAAANTTYSWSPATGLSSATAAQPTVTLTNLTGAPVTTTYTLTATTNGCISIGTVQVTVTPPATANAGPARSFCSGGSAQLGTPAAANTTYSWSPATGLSSATAAQPTVTLTNLTGAPITTTYTLTATTTFQLSPTTSQTCSATSTVTVTVNPAAVANPGPAVSFCSGGSAQLGAAPVAGTTYSWSPATGLSSATVANPTLTLTNTTSAPITTTYTLTATTGNGCVATATVLVTVSPAAVAVAGPNQALCSGGSVQLGTAPVAGTTYNWSPATGLSSATVANPTFTLTNPGTTPIVLNFTLTATTGSSCTATSTVTVTVNPGAVANAGPNRTVCALQPTQLGSGPVAGTTYSWSPTTGLSDPTAANPVLTPPQQGSTPVTVAYTLTATTGNGCVATSTVQVTINPAALAAAGPDRAVCSGVATQIGAGAQPGLSYSWSPTTGLDLPTTNAPFLTLTNTTNAPITVRYVVTASTALGCLARDTVNVTINPAAQPTTGPNVSFCSGGSAQLGAPALAGTTYSWSPATGLSSAIVANPTVTGTNNTGAPVGTIYTLTATTANGCTASASVTVTVNPAAVANPGPAVTTCSGVAVTLGVAPIPGTTYSWTPTTGLSDPTAANPVLTLTNATGTPFTTTYTLTATTANTCTASATVTVTVNPAAVATPGPAVSFCSGGSAQLGVAPVAGTTYSWSPTTGLSSATVSNPTVTLTNTTGAPITTAYILTATTGNGCVATATVLVTVNQAAVAVAGPDRTICSGLSAQLGTTAVAGTTYSWSPILGLSSATASNPTITLTNTTGTPITTAYTLTATTAQGCTATSTVQVTVNPAAVATPGPAVSFCSGGSAQLGVAPVAGTTYSWSPTTGLSDPTAANPTVSGTNTTGAPIVTTYTLTATTANGCTATGTVVVTINQAAVANAGNDVSQCVSFTGPIGMAPVAGTTYSWSPTTGLSSATVANPTLTLTNASGTTQVATYTLTATTAQGCTATDALTITLFPAAVATPGPAVSFCSGGSAQLGVAPIAGTTYSWSPTTGLSDPTAANPTVTLTNTSGAPITTTYTLTATTANSCVSTNTVVVTVNQAAVATPGPAITTCSDISAQLGVAPVAGTTYSWSPTLGLSSATASNPTITLTNSTNAPVTTTYTLTATTAQGCTATNTVAVTVNPAAVSNPGPGVSFCSGGSAQLGVPAEPGTTYSWSPTTGLSDPNIANPTVTGTNTGSLTTTVVYLLTATNSFGCVTTHGVRVDIFPAAVATTGPAQTFCSGGSAQLGTTAIAGTTYSWSPTTGLSDPNIANPTVSITNTTGAPIITTYTLTATTANGCIATNTVQVTVNQAAVATTGPDQTICSGLSAQLGVASIAGTTYSWSPATNLSSATVSNPTVSGTNTTGTPIVTTYTLTATTAQGCTATSTVQVTVNPAAVASAGPDQTLCSGDPASLGVAPIAGTTYSWSPTTGLSSATVSNPTLTLTNFTTAPISSTYTLTATTANGCVATDAATITVNPAPVVDAGANRTVCADERTTLGLPARPGYTYSWSPAAGLSSATAAQPVFTALNATGAPITATFTLTVTTPEGCVAADAVAININPRPAAEAILGSASVCPTVTGVAYSVVNPVATAYQWLVTGGTIASGQGTPAITVDWGTAGTGRVRLFRLNSFGCSSDTTNLSVIINQVLQTPTPTGPGDITATPATPVCQADGPYTYATVPYTNGSLYSWTIIGGTQASTNLNSVTVNWNPVTVPTIGKIVVTETSNPASGVRCLGTSDTLRVRINPSPLTNLAITGPVRVCQGGSVTFTLAGGFAGSTYAFQLDNAPVAGSGNAVTLTNQTAVGAHVVMVRETTAQGCAGPLYTYSYTVDPTPAAVAITGSRFVCDITQPLQYSVPNTSTSTYQWSVTGGTITAGQNTSQVTVQFTAGQPSYRVSVTETSGFGCAGPAAALTVLPDNPSLTLAVASVDVTSNNRVVLTFTSPGSTNTPNQIRVLRRVAGQGAFASVGTVAASATSYTDNSGVDAKANSYEYQLELTNGCGTVLQSVVTQTIRLAATATAGTGGRNQGSTALSWNAYVGFPVQEYRIYRRDDAGNAVQITQVSGTTLTTVVPNSSSGFDQCFRIVAVSAAGILSNSNEDCVNFTNAVTGYTVITPNRDGMNDVLEFDNIKLYPGNTLTIFNRWGREVYNTSNYQNNWGGDEVSAGTYYYLLKMPNGSIIKNWFEIVK